MQLLDVEAVMSDGSSWTATKICKKMLVSYQFERKCVHEPVTLAVLHEHRRDVLLVDPPILEACYDTIN